MPDSTRSTALVLVLSVALVASAAFVGVGFGQQAEDDADDTELSTQNTSYLRIAHAAPGAASVDVSVDNETVAEGVAFDTFSDYIALESGNHTITVSVVDTPDEVVFNETVDLEPRSVTTVTAAIAANDSEGGVVPVAYDDSAATPADDEAALRIAHLSPNAPAVDIVAVESGEDSATEETATETEANETDEETATEEAEATDEAATGETVLAENVSYTEATEYANVPAGDYTVEVRVAAEDNDGSVVASTDLSLESGVAHTAWALGNVPEDGEEMPPTFRVATTQDASKTIDFPGAENETEETDTETESEDGETTEEETTEEETTDEETTEEETTDEETTEEETTDEETTEEETTDEETTTDEEATEEETTDEEATEEETTDEETTEEETTDEETTTDEEATEEETTDEETTTDEEATETEAAT
ncbi:DUF4397 domain-containing protein [Halomicrobium sp. LC1Hm]|uniref:DUF4397 domain-containing protein n=1 Tax=Halomicrobium sp. LC1Hm TaxID=2610902 RepID=UPI0012A8E5DA|nr:DUF4397 domain-containing protein [Halomicrobium sp. LC1Hm]QGA81219.1 DUF4397 family protein [Halomicrobium sp. LC1Hm]